ncbi:MAG: DUF3599 family protein [Clostridia bacterium]|nr:DUF3599 family protein [Clostridia bacterium]
MALSDFFNHTCNIHHIQTKEVDKGYDIKDKEYFYDKTPDIENIPCHFYIKTLEQLVHNEPQPTVTGRMKLALPIDTDIRSNDRVVNNITGLCYIAEVVHNIRNHHIMVYLFREDEAQIPKEGVGRG